jgi:hypothetical protein
MKKDPILEKYKNKAFMICLPGSYFSGSFLVNIMGLHSTLLEHGIKVYFSQMQSPEIHLLRGWCGGGTHENGIYQSPFEGRKELPEDFEYDYILWIDSDIIFNLDSFTKLLDMDKDIATGWYFQKDGQPAAGFFDKTKMRFTDKNPPFVDIWDRDYVYSYKNDNLINTKTEPYVIDWCGMGWMLIKRGVMEKLKYPWFMPKITRTGKNTYEATSEDLAFAMNLREAGIEIWMNPLVRVGHEKLVVL